MHLSYSGSSFSLAAKELQNNSSADFSSFFSTCFHRVSAISSCNNVINANFFSPQVRCPLLHPATVFLFCCFLPNFFHFLGRSSNISTNMESSVSMLLSSASSSFFLAILPHLPQIEYYFFAKVNYSVPLWLV